MGDSDAPLLGYPIFVTFRKSYKTSHHICTTWQPNVRGSFRESEKAFRKLNETFPFQYVCDGQIGVRWFFVLSTRYPKKQTILWSPWRLWTRYQMWCFEAAVALLFRQSLDFILSFSRSLFEQQCNHSMKPPQFGIFFRFCTLTT